MCLCVTDHVIVKALVGREVRVILSYSQMPLADDGRTVAHSF